MAPIESADRAEGKRPRHEGAGYVANSVIAGPLILIVAGNHGYLLLKIPGWIGHKENLE